MHSWASVKEIQFYCGGLDFIHTYVLRKLTFLPEKSSPHHLWFTTRTVAR